MLPWRKSSVQTPMPGRGSLKTIINSQYSSLLASVIGVASATYFFIIGPRNLVAITGITVTFFASALNVSYLVLHHILAWRYVRQNSNRHRHHDDKLRSACMMTSGIVIIAWLTASILGLIAASKAPFCADDAPGTLEWKSLDGCKIQRASVAGSLLNMLNSCVLFYTLKTSARPFAASLLGINMPEHLEEQLHLSTQLSLAFSDSPNEKHFGLNSCGSNSHSTPVAPKPLPRGRRSWLPRLEFQTPLSVEHPALQYQPYQITTAHSQTNLLPSSNHLTLFKRSSTGTGSHPPLPFTRSQTATTLSSSIYSRLTNASTTDFSRTLSSFSSTSTSHSRNPHRLSSFEPEMPAMPERYLHQSHSLRNGGKPVRPGSRPAMPPVDFWMYARSEQQNNDALPPSQPRERRLPIWSGAELQVRPRQQSESPTKSNLPNTSSSARHGHNAVPITSPVKAVLKPSMNKGNMNMGVPGRNRNYEHLRKGSKYCDNREMNWGKLEADLLLGLKGQGHGRKYSRTLVKMRQPWDSPPKSPSKGEMRKL